MILKFKVLPTEEDNKVIINDYDKLISIVVEASRVRNLGRFYGEFGDFKYGKQPIYGLRDDDDECCDIDGEYREYREVFTSEETSILSKLYMEMENRPLTVEEDNIISKHITACRKMKLEELVMEECMTPYMYLEILDEIETEEEKLERFKRELVMLEDKSSRLRFQAGQCQAAQINITGRMIIEINQTAVHLRAIVKGLRLMTEKLNLKDEKILQ